MMDLVNFADQCALGESADSLLNALQFEQDEARTLISLRG